MDGISQLIDIDALVEQTELGVDPQKRRGALLDPPLETEPGTLQSRLGIDPRARKRRQLTPRSERSSGGRGKLARRPS